MNAGPICSSQAHLLLRPLCAAGGPVGCLSVGCR